METTSRTMMLRCAQKIAIAIPALFVAVLTTGCTKPERHFESVVQVTRLEVLEEDDNGKAIQAEVEFEWDPCPGDQFQVVRGSADFAECMKQYPVGDIVSVSVKQWWDTRGYFTWDIERVGDCRREIDPDEEGSYEKSQECHDVKLQGVVYGFACSKKPDGKLASICPWMKRNLAGSGRERQRRQPVPSVHVTAST